VRYIVLLAEAKLLASLWWNGLHVEFDVPRRSSVFPVSYTNASICAGNEDLDKVAVFPSKWRLQLSVGLPKTLFCVFHLLNATASQGISVQLNGQHIKHEPNPVYLGVTLGRTLSYHAHLKTPQPKLALVIICSVAGWIIMESVCYNPKNVSFGSLLLHCRILCPSLGQITLH